MLSRKTKEWIWTIVIYVVSIRVIIALGTGANSAYDGLMESAFGLQGPNSIAHFVIYLLVFSICTVLFFYFSCKYFMRL